MRSDKEAMDWIVRNVIKHVVGVNCYNANIGTRELNEWCNVGDEALAMTLLENSWNFWCDTHSQEDQIRDKKFTVTREVVDGCRKERRGWGEHGHKAYNGWRAQVKKDREADSKEFDKWLLDKMKGRRPTRRGRWSTDLEEVVVVENDFSDEEPEKEREEEEDEDEEDGEPEGVAKIPV